MYRPLTRRARPVMYGGHGDRFTTGSNECTLYNPALHPTADAAVTKTFVVKSLMQRELNGFIIMQKVDPSHSVSVALIGNGSTANEPVTSNIRARGGNAEYEKFYITMAYAGVPFAEWRQSLIAWERSACTLLSGTPPAFGSRQNGNAQLAALPACLIFFAKLFRLRMPGTGNVVLFPDLHLGNVCLEKDQHDCHRGIFRLIDYDGITEYTGTVPLDYDYVMNTLCMYLPAIPSSLCQILGLKPSSLATDRLSSEAIKRRVVRSLTQPPKDADNAYANLAAEFEEIAEDISALISSGDIEILHEDRSPHKSPAVGLRKKLRYMASPKSRKQNKTKGDIEAVSKSLFSMSP